MCALTFKEVWYFREKRIRCGQFKSLIKNKQHFFVLLRKYLDLFVYEN